MPSETQASDIQMDDSCAVCADTLDWVAYGRCGHREVCSTCVVRLRCVLHDRRCCICKTENPVVFITRAMGDYTRVITDFSRFPPGATEGVAGEYWYHEETEAYFDDRDQYRMISAMCMLSCSLCISRGTIMRATYKNIEQLKGHLFYHHHKLSMCDLCLEGRKVFICEQKLFTIQQLKQHMNTGDSQVDGSVSERGGFMGHPMCGFCKRSFYGDSELYKHMSTEHFTCHICKRRHPGQIDYYKSYDDLEMHFRQEHYLCEDEACLAEKFIVFQSQHELKRHNVMEHKGQMSRSRRNDMLQVPTSFRLGGNNEEDRHGFEEPRVETSISDIWPQGFPSVGRPAVDHGDTSQNGEAVSDIWAHLFPPAARPAVEQGDTSQNGSITGSSESSVQSQNSMDAPVMEESSFPPLSDRELFPPLSGRKSSHAGPASQNTAQDAESSGSDASISKEAKKGKSKKASKFHRVRFGDGSAAAYLESLSRREPTPQPSERGSSSVTEGNPVRGVWRNGGGIRLVTNSPFFH